MTAANAASPSTRRSGALETLALCPVLAPIHDVGHGLAVALALGFVIVCATAGYALAKLELAAELERPALALVLGASAAIAARLTEAFAFDLYTALALFLGVIASNGLALATAERALHAARASAASLRAVGAAALGAASHAAALIVAFAALREALAHASLLGGVGAFVGASPDAFRVDLGFAPIGVAASPAGALLVFAVLAACLPFRHR